MPNKPFDDPRVKSEWLAREQEFRSIFRKGMGFFVVYIFLVSVLVLVSPSVSRWSHTILIVSTVFWVLLYFTIKGIILRCPKCNRTPFYLGHKIPAFSITRKNCLWCGYKLK